MNCGTLLADCYLRLSFINSCDLISLQKPFYLLNRSARSPYVQPLIIAGQHTQQSITRDFLFLTPFTICETIEFLETLSKEKSSSCDGLWGCGVWDTLDTLSVTSQRAASTKRRHRRETFSLIFLGKWKCLEDLISIVRSLMFPFDGAKWERSKRTDCYQPTPWWLCQEDFMNTSTNAHNSFESRMRVWFCRLRHHKKT